MDQDFHYNATYYAARIGGGYSEDEAITIAKASNFVDFLNNTGYGGYWKIICDEQKKEDRKYTEIGHFDYPRYTFQGTLSIGTGGGSEGLWASYHFLPGNYSVDGTPTAEEVHGKHVAESPPGHTIREIKNKTISKETGELLNRPQSVLSRLLIQDTIECIDTKRLKAILEKAVGGKEIIADSEENVSKFRLLLLGLRAHVIADNMGTSRLVCKK